MHDIEPLNAHQYAMRCRCNRLFTMDVVTDPGRVVECRQCGDSTTAIAAVQEHEKQKDKMKG